ncbi:glycosyltransferase family 4 protein [Lentisphaerota bacterium WC36G]|nr:glycosyltransferase family 4 protein [Lentisphaerae bacterium WC36]
MIEKTKKVVFFTRYAENGASSRLRFLQYIPILNKHGIEIKVKNFFSKQYLKNKYKKKSYGITKIFKLYLKQFKFLLENHKDFNTTWFIEYELLPFIPYFIEKLFLKNRRYILNFDDNVWEKYQRAPFKYFLKNKYYKLIKNAKNVIVANHFLADKVKQYNDNIVFIPTAIDATKYQRHQNGKFERFTVAWIGTPETFHYVRNSSSIWQKLAEKVDYKFLIIARESLKDYEINGVDMEFINWSERIEATLLPQCHIGVMPLDDSNFSLGKSAYKIIQYFASGVVPIASNVGENNHVIHNNHDGFLVQNDDQWVSVIEELYNDRNLLERLSINATASAKKFDIKVYSEKILSLID